MPLLPGFLPRRTDAWSHLIQNFENHVFSLCLLKTEHDFEDIDCSNPNGMLGWGSCHLGPVLFELLSLVSLLTDAIIAILGNVAVKGLYFN